MTSLSAAAAGLALLLASPVFAATVSRSSPTLTAAQLGRYFEGTPPADNGVYGQATTVLEDLYATHASSKDAVVAVIVNRILQDANIVRELGGRDNATRVLTDLVGNRANVRSVGLLLAATAGGDSGIWGRLLTAYNRVKNGPPPVTFRQFLERFAAGAPGDEDALLRSVLTPGLTHGSPSVNTPSGGSPPPPGGGPPGGPGSRTTVAGMSDLYGSGFDTPGGVRLALNVVFNPSSRSQELVLNNITNSGAIRGRNVTLADLQQGPVRVVLGAPGQANAPTFVLHKDGDRIVVKTPQGQELQSFTLRQLYEERARRVRTGGIVRIGDREFYVGAEGHSGMGWVTYWPKELIDRFRSSPQGFDFNTLVPEAAAPAAERDGNAFKPYDSGFIAQGSDGKYWYQRWRNGAMVIESSDTPPTDRERGVTARPPAGENIQWDQPPADGRITESNDTSQLRGWYRTIPLQGNRELRAANAINGRLDPSVLANVRIYEDSTRAGTYVAIFNRRLDSMVEIKNPEVLVDGGRATLLLSRDGDEIKYYDLRLARGINMRATDGRYGGLMVGAVNLRDKKADGNGQITNLTVLEDVLKRLGFDTAANVSGGARTRLQLIVAAAQRRAGGRPFQVQVNGNRVLLQMVADLSSGRAYEIWPLEREITLPTGSGSGGYGTQGLRFDSTAWNASTPDVQPSPDIRDGAQNGIQIGTNRAASVTALPDDRVSYANGADQSRIRVYVANGTLGTGQDRRPINEWVLLAVADGAGDHNYALAPFTLFSDDSHHTAVHPRIPSGVTIHLSPLSVASGVRQDPTARQQWQWQRVPDGNTPFEQRGVLALYDGRPSSQGSVTPRTLIGVAAYWGMTREEAQRLADGAR